MYMPEFLFLFHRVGSGIPPLSSRCQRSPLAVCFLFLLHAKACLRDPEDFIRVSCRLQHAPLFPCSLSCHAPPVPQMVCLWSLRSYTFIRNLTGGIRKTLYLLSSCDFSPDGALLATAAFSGSSWWIDLWDPYTAEKLATLV